MMRLGLLAAVLLGCGCSHQEPGLSGVIEYDLVEIRATDFATVVALPVERGQLISAGTVIARLDPTEQALRLAASKAAVDASIAAQQLLLSGTRSEQIKQAQAQLNEAESRWHEAELNLRRERRLLEQNLTSAAALDHAIANRDAAAAEVERRHAQLEELRNGARMEELDQAAAQTDQARARMGLTSHHLEELTLVSPVTGSIDSLPVVIGDRVNTGETVATLITGTPWVRFYLPQAERARFHIGDSLQIKVDGVEQLIPASLRSVAQNATFTPFFALNDRDRGHLSYLAEADLDTTLQLPAGFPVQVFHDEP